jgi:thioredoxin-like negative regulator of GroEL
VLGLRQFPDAPRLERQLAGVEGRLRRRLPFPFDYDQLPVSPPERAVLAMCARPVGIGELLAMPIARADLVRAVAALLAGGLVGEVPQDARREAAAPAAAPPEAPRAEAGNGGADAVEVVLEREAEATPEDALRAARSLLERGERGRAILTLSDALRRHPSDRGLRRLLVVTLSREGPFDPQVERQFTQALADAPTDTELRYELATYYRRHGVSARALLHLRLVLSVDPGHAAAWRDLAELEAGPRER